MIEWCGQRLEDMDATTAKKFIQNIVYVALQHPGRWDDCWAADVSAIFKHLAEVKPNC